jgi:hypothetical protein
LVDFTEDRVNNARGQHSADVDIWRTMGGSSPW